MQNFRNSMTKFQELNAQVLGVSVDSFAAQKEFAKQNGVQFPLLSDFGKNAASRAYGVFNEERSVASRVTFVIDMNGIIRSIEAGNSAISAEGALAALESLK